MITKSIQLKTVIYPPFAILLDIYIRTNQMETSTSNFRRVAEFHLAVPKNAFTDASFHLMTPSSFNRPEMKNFPEVVEHVELLMMIQKTFPESSQKQWEQLYQDVFKCVANKTYVSGRRNFQC